MDIKISWLVNLSNRFLESGIKQHSIKKGLTNNIMGFKVYIRADGSLQIGLGHLVRCSALANMIKDYFEVNFISKEIPDTMFAELNKSGFNCTKIESEEEFFCQLNDKSIAVLDDYRFGTDYQKKVKGTGAKLVCIDDLHDKEFVADLIINHAPGITLQDYKAKSYTQFALGIEYALLRPVFLEQAKKTREIGKIEKLLICFGGGDLKNLTLNTLKVSLEFKEFIKIIVVTGAAYKITEDFKQLIKSDKRIDHRHALNDKQMLTAMLEAELAILPSSGILYEALATKCLVISGTYMDNQILLYESAKKQHLFIDAVTFSKAKLIKAIKQAFSPSFKLSQKIDGNSGRRILNSILRSTVSLKSVSINDSEVLYNLVNDPEVRKNSFNSKIIQREEHNSWFFHKVNSTKCKMYILYLMDSPVGQIRFDLNENSEWEIDYSIDKKFRGKGLGRCIIELGLNKLGEYSAQIIAFVKPENRSSIKIFESLGFQKTEYVHLNNGYLKFGFQLVVSEN